MADENNFRNSPGILDDIEYVDTARKSAPTGVSAPILDDMGFVDTSERKGAPQGVAAPVLDDMSTPYQDTSSRRGAPTGVAAPILDDMTNYDPVSPKKGTPQGVSAPILDSGNDVYSSPASQKLVMSDDDIIAGLTPELKEKFESLPDEMKQQVINMRRQQLGAEAPAPTVSAPILDEDNYVPPPKKEEPPQPSEPIKAPILDDEPEVPKYERKFVDEDLERAKKEGAKQAVSSQLTSNQKDSQESLKMMIRLKEERQAELAEKGFKICIVLAILGIIGAVTFYLLYAGKLGLEYKDGMSGISKVIGNSAMYLSVAEGLCALTLISGIGGFKSLASFVYLVLGIIQIFPGCVMIPQHEGSMGLVAVLYAVSLICTIAVFVSLSASEAVGLYFKKNQH